jgi:hypothetical protein
MLIEVENIWLEYPDGMVEDEARQYIPIGKQIWTEDRKLPLSTMGGIVVTMISQTMDVLVNPQPHIKRVRRITGYLSTLDQFNDAKRGEAAARTVTQL